jgi:hypothetical protein
MISGLQQLSTRTRDLQKFRLVVGSVFLLLGGWFLFLTFRQTIPEITEELIGKLSLSSTNARGTLQSLFFGAVSLSTLRTFCQ